MAMPALTALIIHPNPYKRALIKQATMMMGELERVYQASSFVSALSRIETIEGSCDLVLSASELDPVEGEEFIQRVLEFRAARDAAFIVILDKNDQSIGSVAQTLLSGANGILMTPFSIEDISNVVGIAAVVKKQRASARQRQALRLVINGIIKKLDLIWYNCCYDLPMGFALRDLRAAASLLPGLSEEELGVFFELATEMLGELPPPPVIEKKVGGYRGASSRVKKKVEGQSKENLASILGDSAPGEKPS